MKYHEIITNYEVNLSLLTWKDDCAKPVSNKYKIPNMCSVIPVLFLISYMYACL